MAKDVFPHCTCPGVRAAMSVDRAQDAGKRYQRSPPQPDAVVGLPPELLAELGASALSVEECRAALVRLGYCTAGHPAVTLELYGSLRLKTGWEMLPLHANTVGEAVEILRHIHPKAARLLPAPVEIEKHFRFAINGGAVTGDVSHRLRDGDHVVLFSASVGG